MAQPNLVVNFHFNPPTIRLIGPIKETTVEKLNQVFPRMTSTAGIGRKAPPRFQLQSSPPHWYLELQGHFCDQLGQSMLYLALLDALEEEGGWILKDCNAITMEDTDVMQQSHYESAKFFFVKKI
eukprot:TRINITY_DN5570_c0_g1_i1.p1 TRINITY_DN5570_c0_g1~~TRINITY_DN5570_c0_g1_i1.p1  ORF type:complete len:125 (+),score=44.82 TRINITY_DN5570_c0_g1_i1:69-443(+)